MTITGGFGMTYDLSRGSTRRWVMGRDGVKRWCDTGAVIGCDDCQGEGEYFTHSDECCDERCALNGDYHSCPGRIVRCGCMPPASKVSAS